MNKVTKQLRQTSFLDQAAEGGSVNFCVSFYTTESSMQAARARSKMWRDEFGSSYVSHGDTLGQIICPFCFRNCSI